MYERTKFKSKFFEVRSCQLVFLIFFDFQTQYFLLFVQLYIVFRFGICILKQSNSKVKIILVHLTQFFTFKHQTKASSVVAFVIGGWTHLVALALEFDTQLHWVSFFIF